MSVPLWPSDLPQEVLQEGFQESFGEGRLSTKMETGIPKTRRRFSAVGRPIQAALILTIDQRARFKSFWDDDTSLGSLPFFMPDQLADGLALIANGLSLTDTSGTPLVTESWWLVMFGETPPSVRPLSGDIYRAEFGLTILP